jgi:glyoxylase-like metal-dependent hydrolase (beta-lactamase superfamily II)
MADYMMSLGKLIERDDRIYYPAHGDPVEEPRRFVSAIAMHRRQRERQILDLLGEEAQPIQAMVERMYSGIDPRLHGAAGRSVLAHLIDLETRQEVARDGDEWVLTA